MPFLRFVAANARWLAGGFLLTFFSSFGQTFFIALSNGEIRGAFGLSHGEFGGLYMLATLGSAATLPFLGRVLDRLPAATVAAGTMLMLASAAALMSLASSVVLLVAALYLLRLFGQGMMTQTAPTATARWFAVNRGRAISVVTIGQQVGEGLFPVSFVIIAGLVGWRGGWLAAAGAVLLVALPLVTLLIRHERNPSSELLPETVGSVCDRTLSEVVRDPLFYLLIVGVLAPPFIGTTIFFHQVYLTEIRGWPLELFASGFALMSATTFVFALVAGWLIDRFSAVQLLPVFLVPLAGACFAITNLSAPWTIFVFMGLLGLSYGFSTTLFGALWPEIYGTRHLGAIRSVTVAMMVFATALGPGVTGALIDLGVPYPLQLNVMGLYCIGAACVMALVARRIAAARQTQGLIASPGGID